MKKLLLSLLSVMISVPALIAQNVGVDVATPEQKLDVAGAIKVGNTTNGVAGSLRWNGSSFQFHDGTQWITLNANTDDQQFDVIQLNGTDLELSIEDDGQATYTVDLSSFLDNTDAQQFDQVSINGSNQLLLSLSNDGQATHVLDLSGYLDNTDEQGFDIVQLSGTNLELSLQNDGVGTHVIDLSSLAVDTDDQSFDVAQLVGTNLELSLEDDGVPTEVIDLSSLADNTDDQTFDVVNITSDELRLSLENDGQATHVLDLSPYKDNTDNQTFDVVQLTGNNLELSLEDDGQATHVIDLSGFADNTDDQKIDVLSLAGNTLNISLEDDAQANQTLDLSQFMDNTDNQQLNDFSLSGNTLSLNIEDAGGIQTVDLSGYLDNTDNQTIDVFNLSGNNLQLSIEDDAQATQTVDLSGYLDNTDDQSVTDFSLSGTTLSLQIESDAGGVQTVDLSSIQQGLVDDDGDTKVDVEATPDEDQIRFSTAGGEAMRINTTQQVGIGLSTDINNKLVVNGSNADATAVLGLRGGNQVTTFNGGAQIAFGYDGDDAYQHFIHTRHNSAGGAANNAIDFYVSDGTQNNTVTTGSTHVMSLNSGNVGIGTVAPDQKLEVNGVTRITGNLLMGDNGSSTNDIYIGDRIIDWDNTGYYLDPDGVNRVNEIMADDGSAGDVSYHFAGDSNTGFYQPGDNQIGFSINGTERMRLNTVGNLGIGVGGPTEKLHVAGGARVTSLGGSGNAVVLADNNGVLSSTNTLVGTGLGDNLGNHTATTAITMNDNNINDANDISVNRLFDGDGGDNIEVHDHLMMRDNLNLRLGNGSDFRMWHDGTNHYFRDYFHAGGNIYFQGEDSGGSNEALVYMYSNGGAGYVRLYQNGSERLETTSVGVQINNANVIRSQPSGDYGSIQVDGGGKGAYEGYSINGRYVLMNDDDNTIGLYNDINNRWIWLYERNDRLDVYDPDYAANSVAWRFDNNQQVSYRDINMTDDDIWDANYVETDNIRDADGGTQVEVYDDFEFNDNDVWDVNRLTVNTIYAEDANNSPSNRVDIIDYMRWDNPASAYDTYVDSYGSEPLFRPGSQNWGYLGKFNNYWYYLYSNNIINVSQRSTKRDIKPLDELKSAEDLILSDIDELRPSLYKYKVETDDIVAGMETKYRAQYHLGFILDETPDYLQDNEFGGIDVYALSSMSMVGVKDNRERIQALEEGRGTTKINDFGSTSMSSNEVWVSFDESFTSQLTTSQLPVVNVTPNALGVEIAVTEKTADGFKVVKSTSESISLDWVAYAKVQRTADESGKQSLPANVLNQLHLPQAAKEKVKLIQAADEAIKARLQAEDDAWNAENEIIEQENLRNQPPEDQNVDDPNPKGMDAGQGSVGSNERDWPELDKDPNPNQPEKRPSSETEPKR